jgi:hypothetical protein
VSSYLCKPAGNACVFFTLTLCLQSQTATQRAADAADLASLRAALGRAVLVDADAGSPAREKAAADVDAAKATAAAAEAAAAAANARAASAAERAAAAEAALEALQGTLAQTRKALEDAAEDYERRIAALKASLASAHVDIAELAAQLQVARAELAALRFGQQQQDEGGANGGGGDAAPSPSLGWGRGGNDASTHTSGPSPAPTDARLAIGVPPESRRSVVAESAADAEAPSPQTPTPGAATIAIADHEAALEAMRMQHAAALEQALAAASAAAEKGAHDVRGSAHDLAAPPPQTPTIPLREHAAAVETLRLEHAASLSKAISAAVAAASPSLPAEASVPLSVHESVRAALLNDLGAMRGTISQVCTCGACGVWLEGAAGCCRGSFNCACVLNLGTSPFRSPLALPLLQALADVKLSEAALEASKARARGLEVQLAEAEAEAQQLRAALPKEQVVALSTHEAVRTALMSDLAAMRGAIAQAYADTARSEAALHAARQQISALQSECDELKTQAFTGITPPGPAQPQLGGASSTDWSSDGQHAGTLHAGLRRISIVHRTPRASINSPGSPPLLQQQASAPSHASELADLQRQQELAALTQGAEALWGALAHVQSVLQGAGTGGDGTLSARSRSPAPSSSSAESQRPPVTDSAAVARHIDAVVAEARAVAKRCDALRQALADANAAHAKLAKSTQQHDSERHRLALLLEEQVSWCRVRADTAAVSLSAASHGLVPAVPAFLQDSEVGRVAAVVDALQASVESPEAGLSDRT